MERHLRIAEGTSNVFLQPGCHLALRGIVSVAGDYLVALVIPLTSLSRTVFAVNGGGVSGANPTLNTPQTLCQVHRPKEGRMVRTEEKKNSLKGVKKEDFILTKKLPSQNSMGLAGD